MTTADDAFVPCDAPLARDARLRDAQRRAVAAARASHRPLRLLALLAGPGMLVMLGENDGPSMLSYATTGAAYGIGFFVPFIVVTFVAAFIVQEMTVRLGAATQRGHAELIFERFGPFWGYFAMGDLIVGNLLTLVTEFVAVQAGALYFGVPAWASVGSAVVLVGIALATRRYVTWERALLVLAFGNLLFIPAALLAHPSGGELLHAMRTWGPLPGGSSVLFLTLVLANIGATVTPWMIFFQQSSVVDKGLDASDIPQGRIDTGIGAGVAAIVAIAAVVVASTLSRSHQSVASLVSGADFATALRPHIGNAGASLFALGIIEAGLLAAMTVSTSSAYAFGETFRFGHSLNLDFSHGKIFYGVAFCSATLAAVVVLIPHAPLLAMTLTVNVIATLMMVPALLFLLLLVNDRDVMGPLVNSIRANVAGGTIVAAISLVGALYGAITIFPRLLPH